MAEMPISMLDMISWSVIHSARQDIRRAEPGEAMAAGWTSSKRVPKFGFRVITRDADDPLRWGHVIAQALAAEEVGFDRVIVSGDHVVFGEHLEAYGNPELGGRLGGRLGI